MCALRSLVSPQVQYCTACRLVTPKQVVSGRLEVLTSADRRSCLHFAGEPVPEDADDDAEPASAVAKVRRLRGYQSGYFGEDVRSIRCCGRMNVLQRGLHAACWHPICDVIHQMTVCDTHECEKESSGAQITARFDTQCKLLTRTAIKLQTR
jgi:hypothetical protein